MRHYGFLANRRRKRKLASARAALARDEAPSARKDPDRPSLALQPVRTAIEPGRKPPQRAGIGVDRLVALALQLQGPQVFPVQLGEAVLLGFVHGKLFKLRALIGCQTRVKQDELGFPPSSGFVQQRVESDAG